MNWPRCSSRSTPCCAKPSIVTMTGALEAGDLSAFNLVLEQFHHAVVDRRVALDATEPGPLRFAGAITLGWCHLNRAI